VLFGAEGGRQVRASDLLVIESGQPQTSEDELTAAGVTRNYLSTKAPYRDAQGNIIGIVGISRDITERVRGEKELARTNRALQLLGRGNEALIRAHSESGLLHEICEVAVDVGGARMAWVGYAEEDVNQTITPQAQAGFDEGYLAEVPHTWAEDRPECRGPEGNAIRTGLPVTVNDLAAPDAGFPSLAAAQARGYGGVVCLPLKEQSVTFGVLALYLGEVREVPADELRLLQDLADDMAYGILNQRVRNDRRRTQEAVMAMARGVSASTGAAFFEKLTLSMVEALGGQVAFVARYDPGNAGWAQTLCAVIDGQPVPNFDYELAGTPCEALEAGEVRIVRRDVRRRYPRAKLLAQFAAEALVCLQLADSKGRPFGLMVVQYRHPLEQAEFVASTLKIFGARAAAELERDQAEARTREQVALIDEARDAIVVCGLDNVIQFWSKGAERIYGWTEAQALGRAQSDLLGVDPAIFAEANRTVREKEEWKGEIRKSARDGRALTVSARWTLLRDREGGPRSILTIDTDVTDRKLLEQQFLRAQRLESIGTLAGGIAHDLNNLLAPIVMGVGLLREYEPAESTQAVIRIIERSAKRGTDLVQQVLSFARGVEGARLSVHLRHVIREVEAMMESTFPKNIELASHTDSDLGLVQGDPTQLNQVLLNLCVNARDAMPNGGTLSVTATNTAIDEQYAVMNHGVTPGRYVRLEVKDTGTGIPPAVLERIFEPFFTTKELGKGTGLGLSTVMGIVRSHGGFVHVASQPGQGSTFSVYLPASDTAAGTALPHGEDELPRGNGELILVVDDEASIRDITRQTLEAFGYRVITAEDGAQAIALFAPRRDEIAVVLTDLMMPVMDGPALIAALRRLYPQVHVIAASGLKSGSTVAPFAETAVQHFLAKPYTAEAMLTLLKEVLSSRSR